MDMNAPRTSPASTPPRLVYTPRPGDPYRRFDAGTEVIYADFTVTPVINGTIWVCEPGSRGAVAAVTAVAVDAYDLSVVA